MTAMATTNETADGLVKGKTAASEDENQAPKANGNEASAMDCDGADEPTRNGDLNKSKNGDGEEDDDDDLSSDIGLIEDDEDIDEMTEKAEAKRGTAALDESGDVEMIEDEAPDKGEVEEKYAGADPERVASRQSVVSDASVEEEPKPEPEIVEHVVKLVVNQLVNVVSLTSSAYRGANTLKRRREIEDDEDLIDEIEEGDIETRIKCVDILSNRHEQIRLKREQR